MNYLAHCSYCRTRGIVLDDGESTRHNITNCPHKKKEDTDIMTKIWKMASKTPLPRDFGKRPWPDTFRALLAVHSFPASNSGASMETSSVRPGDEEASPYSFLHNLTRAPKAPLSWHAYTVLIQNERNANKTPSADVEEPLQYAQPREDDEENVLPPYCAPPPPWDEVCVVCPSA